MSKQIKIIIAGVSGYVGRELLKLVLQHPHLELVGIHSTQEVLELYASFPALKKQQIPVYSLEALSTLDFDLIFLATQAQVSMEIALKLATKACKIIDLSGAFRLSAQAFETWYHFPHSAPHLLKEACYGLSPFENNQANYQLIANPGCYATCILMSLLPLFKANILEKSPLIIDAKSGVSGAGKQLKAEYQFCEIADNFFPYKIGSHQHTPEIEKALLTFADATSKLRLTTSLLPIKRGLATTLYLQGNIAGNALSSAVEDAFNQAYQKYPFVYFSKVGNTQNDAFILSLNNVVNTPNIHIAYFIKDNELTLFSCLDNLLKGAASQAIENMNLMYNWPIQTGLNHLGVLS